MKSPNRADPDRIARYRRGHTAELIAAALLLAKGYRILARRYRCPVGEIDIVAKRGQRLAFVEVKRRPTLEQAEWSVTPRQQARVIRAVEHWMARHPGYQDHEMGLDVILLARRRWPRHMANAFHKPWR